MANPVFWFTTDLVIEVDSFFLFTYINIDASIFFCDQIQVETNTTIFYSLTIENPVNGWEGFLIQVNFPGPDGTALELTTETLIIPDTYPTSDCHDQQCSGSLV